MGLARSLALRALRAHPARTLFSVLGIALGVATVVGVVTLDHNTVLGLAGARRDAGRPDLELTALPGAGGAEALRQVEGVSLVGEFFEQDALLRLPVGAGAEASERPLGVRLLAVDLAVLPHFDVWSLDRGRLPEAGAAEVLLGANLVERLGLELGQRVFLSRPRRAGRTRCVDGQLVQVREGEPDAPEEHALELVGVLGRSGVGRHSLGMLALTDLVLGEAIYAGQPLQKRLWARRDADVDLERLESSLTRSYAYLLNEGAVVGQAADERAFRTGVRLTGLLALVLGLYVIFHTLSMSLQERVREVATLHALGTTRGQLAGVFLLEALLLAGGGALLGLLAGLGLARGLLALGITTLGTGKHVPEFHVPWEVVLPLTLTGFGVALVGSVYPLAAVRGADVPAALRGEQALAGRGSGGRGFRLVFAALVALVLPALYLAVVPTLGEARGPLGGVLGAGIVGLSLVLVLSLLLPGALAWLAGRVARPVARVAPLSGFLAGHALLGSPARVGACTTALALVTAGVVGLKGMTASLAGEVRTWAEEAVVDKLWVEGLPDADWDRLTHDLVEYPGVLGFEPGGMRAEGSFLLLGVEPRHVVGYGPLQDDPEARRTFVAGRGLVLSRRLARDLGYGVGDDVPVPRADGRVDRFQVVAVSDAYGHWPSPDERMYAVVADTWLADAHCKDHDQVAEVAVRFRPGMADPGVLRAALEALFPGAAPRIRQGSGVRDFHLHDLRRDFVLFDVLLVLTALLAGLGLLNGQLLSALERAQSLGVLRALGTTRRQVAGVLLAEGLVLGVVGGLLGTLAGAALTPVVVGALQGMAGLELVPVLPVPWLVLGPLLAILLALLAALVPARRVTAQDPLRAVRSK